MFDLRSFQNKGKVHSWFCRNILRNEDGDFRLSVRSSIQSVFFLFFFISSHISNVTLTFATRFLPSTFPSTNFESICVWCSKHLNDSLIKRLESKKETIQLFNQILVNIVVWCKTWDVKMGGLYCVRQQKNASRNPSWSPSQNPSLESGKRGRLTLCEEKKGMKLKQTTVKIAKIFCSKSS